MTPVAGGAPLQWRDHCSLSNADARLELRAPSVMEPSAP